MITTHNTISYPVIRLLHELMQVNKPIYISGPISGMPDLNQAAFFAAENEIKGWGLKPINPHTVAPGPPSENKPWHEYMKLDLTHMLNAGALLLLPGWQESSGAIWECLTAKTLCIPVINPKYELETLSHLAYMDLFKKLQRKISENDAAIKLQYC